VATNLQIDDSLLTEALELGQFRTKRETVNQALRELVNRMKRQRIWSLEGQVDFTQGFDHKKLRRKR
jgi:Arc/MetJ family transcription regulator